MRIRPRVTKPIPSPKHCVRPQMSINFAKGNLMIPPIKDETIVVVAVKEWYWKALVMYGVRVETMPLEKAC